MRAKSKLEVHIRSEAAFVANCVQINFALHMINN